MKQQHQQQPRPMGGIPSSSISAPASCAPDPCGRASPRPHWPATPERSHLAGGAWPVTGASRRIDARSHPPERQPPTPPHPPPSAAALMRHRLGSRPAARNPPLPPLRSMYALRTICTTGETVSRCPTNHAQQHRKRGHDFLFRH